MSEMEWAVAPQTSHTVQRDQVRGACCKMIPVWIPVKISQQELNFKYQIWAYNCHFSPNMGVFPLDKACYNTRYIAHGIGDHAYCRNPDGAGKPWCYTNELDIRWEECEIPQCGEWLQTSNISRGPQLDKFKVDPWRVAGIYSPVFKFKNVSCFNNPSQCQDVPLVIM